jgi:PilZ domain-containing protein
MTGHSSDGLSPYHAERRRAPRFSCGGLAKIICLPSDGLYLPGKVRDLSLNGCGIDTGRPIECGCRAEMLLQVDSASIRVVGKVKGLRSDGAIGLEFLRLSAGGQAALVELIRELARQQALANTLRTARQEPADWSEARARLLRASLPVFGGIACSMAESGSKPEYDDSALNGNVKIRPVDLFF